MAVIGAMFFNVYSMIIICQYENMKIYAPDSYLFPLKYFSLHYYIRCTSIHTYLGVFPQCMVEEIMQPCKKICQIENYHDFHKIPFLI